jgi:hypothetical protein
VDKVEDVVGAATRLLQERGAPLLAGEAAVAHLLHLFELGQVAHHLLLRQSPEGAKADVPVPGVPAPCRLFAPRRQAHGATGVHLQDVEVSRRSPDLDQQLLPLIEDPEKAGVVVHPTAGLIHLVEAEDVRHKTGNVVHPCQRAVLTTLAREEDGAAPFNLDDGTVAEADRAADVRVELGEWPRCRAPTACTHDPPLGRAGRRPFAPRSRRRVVAAKLGQDPLRRARMAQG